jgi:hypothetical protein
VKAVYKSECGGYLCRSTRDGGRYEAWTRDGAIHWKDDDRIKTWEDEKKASHPLEYCVVGFSAQMTGQKKGSFTLSLAHCDITAIIKPWTGNTIIESRKIVFRRRVPAQCIPHFIRQVSDDESCRSIRASEVAP